MTLSALLSSIGTVVGAVVDWCGSFLSVITATNGLLLLPLILSISLFGIHVMKSLMGR